MSEKQTDQSYTFVHLTDPHLTSLAAVKWPQLMSKRLLGYISWLRKRRAEHRTEVLQALAADLRQQDYQHIVVTGDLTHISLPDEFLQARQWLNSMGQPEDVSIVPGNHDALVPLSDGKGLSSWAPFMSSDAERPSGLSADGFPSLRVRGEVAFIGLSSAVPTLPLSATGNLGEQQREAFAGLLKWAGQRGLCRVVFIHHPPVPGLEKWRKRLRDADEVSRIIDAYGAELVLHGHSHRPRENWLSYAGKSQIPVIGLPSASSIHTEPERVARYNLCSIEATATDWQLSITTQIYSHEEAGFRLFEKKSFVVPRQMMAQQD